MGPQGTQGTQGTTRDSFIVGGCFLLDSFSGGTSGDSGWDSFSRRTSGLGGTALQLRDYFLLESDLGGLRELQGTQGTSGDFRGPQGTSGDLGDQGDPGDPGDLRRLFCSWGYFFRWTLFLGGPQGTRRDSFSRGTSGTSGNSGDSFTTEGLIFIKLCCGGSQGTSGDLRDSGDRREFRGPRRPQGTLL